MSMHNGVSWKNRSPEYRAGMLKKAHNAGLISLPDDIESNREFAEKNGTFIQACSTADVKATKRQASKFRRGLGSAYANRG